MRLGRYPHVSPIALRALGASPRWIRWLLASAGPHGWLGSIPRRSARYHVRMATIAALGKYQPESALSYVSTTSGFGRGETLLIPIMASTRLKTGAPAGTIEVLAPVLPGGGKNLVSDVIPTVQNGPLLNGAFGRRRGRRFKTSVSGY